MAVVTKKLMNKGPDVGVGSGSGKNEISKIKDNELAAYYALTSGKTFSADEGKKYANQVSLLEISDILDKAKKQNLPLDADVKKILETRYDTFVNSVPVHC